MLGGYRDRVVVELAQNAADAAVRAGVPGRLLLRVDEIDGRAVLVAANTGAPLDADGVQALATLRASAKRDDGPADVGRPDHGTTVGRFGVGLRRRARGHRRAGRSCPGTGACASPPATPAICVREAARHAPGLAEELARRDGHVPVLRLPFPAEGSAAAGVRHRGAAAAARRRGRGPRRPPARRGGRPAAARPARARRRSRSSFPGSRCAPVADVEARWHVLRRTGDLDPASLADRPTEERARKAWSVAWAVPLSTSPGSADPELPRVVYAPTPSDEPLPWPALLVATFPLDSARRHVAPGPATDAILRHAARAYADLLARAGGRGDDLWGLVPVGLPAGALDAHLRDRLLQLLPGTPLLRDAGEPGRLLAPRDAVALEPPAGSDVDVVSVLAAVARRSRRRPAGRFGRAGSAAGRSGSPWPTRSSSCRRRRTRPGPGGATPRWRGSLDDPLAREALAALPVPAGRRPGGARGAGPAAAGRVCRGGSGTGRARPAGGAPRGGAPAAGAARRDPRRCPFGPGAGERAGAGGRLGGRRCRRGSRGAGRRRADSGRRGGGHRRAERRGPAVPGRSLADRRRRRAGSGRSAGAARVTGGGGARPGRDRAGGVGRWSSGGAATCWQPQACWTAGGAAPRRRPAGPRCSGRRR